VADRGAAGQAGGQFGVAEGLADKALVTLGIEAVVMDAGDAAGFLAAMLQGVQAQGWTLAMPQASWPRCCRACRPRATIDEASFSGAPQTPQTPHSNRS